MASINKENLKLGDNKKFQLILVGLDGSEVANAKYMTSKKINFPGLKLEGRDSIDDLLSIGNTGFIPQIVVLKANRELVTNDENQAIEMLKKLASGS